MLVEAMCAISSRMINAAPSGQPALRGHHEPEALLLSCASGGGLAGWFGRGETQSDPGLTSVSESNPKRLEAM